MKKILVVCGDSFNYGIGCLNLDTEPYGPRVANYFNYDLIRLARGSASNYIIYLQSKFAIDIQPKPHLIIIGTTSIDRIEWVAENKRIENTPKLEQVNYHLYPPHYHTPPGHDKPMNFYLKDSPNYSPAILSEQVIAFSDYQNVLKGIKKGLYDYYTRLHTEPLEKIKLIEDYYMQIFNTNIKRDYDRGVIMMGYHAVKKAGIKCIICSNDIEFKNLVEKEEEFFNADWGRLVAAYPDLTGSMHTSGDGHKDLADRLIDHIKLHNLG